MFNIFKWFKRSPKKKKEDPKAPPPRRPRKPTVVKNRRVIRKTIEEYHTPQEDYNVIGGVTSAYIISDLIDGPDSPPDEDTFTGGGGNFGGGGSSGSWDSSDYDSGSCDSGSCGGDD